MCGIVGYIGREQAAPVLLDGLARLEYRGYDSSGIAIIQNGRLVGAVTHVYVGEPTMGFGVFIGWMLQN